MRTATLHDVRRSRSIAPALLPLLLMACAAPIDDEEATPSTTEHVTLVAHFELEGGQVDFYRDANGGILLSEDVPIGEMGLIEEMLARGEGPLELYERLDEAETTIPSAIASHHLRRQEWRADSELPPPTSFGPTWDFSAGADCTQASDLPWFRSVWQGQGHSWHRYYNRHLGSGTNKKTPWTGLTEEFFTHMCNYSIGNGFARHRIEQENIDSTRTIGPGIRHIFWWSSPGFATRYRGQMRNDGLTGGNAKLGGSAP